MDKLVISAAAYLAGVLEQQHKGKGDRGGDELLDKRPEALGQSRIAAQPIYAIESPAERRHFGIAIASRRPATKPVDRALGPGHGANDCRLCC